MNTSEARTALLLAMTEYEQARSAFFDPANAADEIRVRNLGAAFRNYEAKFDALIASTPHADALRWYHTVLKSVGEHLLGCGREGLNPFGTAAAAETWRLMRSWGRMEAEIAALGYRTISLEGVLRASLNSLSSQFMPLFNALAAPREDNPYPVLHAFTWTPHERSSSDNMREFVEIIERIAKSGSDW